MQYFNKLNYSLGDEDPTPDLLICEDLSAKSIAVVAGSGLRPLMLASRAPDALVCVDLSKAQLSLAEMRLRAVQQLEPHEFMAFMGYPCARALLATERRERFESLRLDEGAKGLLREQFEADHWQAAIYLGGFERLLLRLSRVIRPLLGRGIEDIFETTDIAEQRHFMERRFPRKRWQSLLRIIGSATMLNALLYRGAFPRAERGRASSQHLAAAFEQIFANIRCRDSFFLQLLFLGEIRFPEAVPGEGQGEVLTTIRAALEDIDLRFVLADITRPSQWTSEQFDAIFLSDVPSFLGKDAEARFLQEIRPALSPLGTAITRESVRAISPDLDGFRDISPSYAELSAQETTQLWTIKVYQNQP